MSVVRDTISDSSPNVVWHGMLCLLFIYDFGKLKKTNKTQVFTSKEIVFSASPQEAKVGLPQRHNGKYIMCSA